MNLKGSAKNKVRFFYPNCEFKKKCRIEDWDQLGTKGFRRTLIPNHHAPFSLHFYWELSPSSSHYNEKDFVINKYTFHLFFWWFIPSFFSLNTDHNFCLRICACAIINFLRPFWLMFFFFLALLVVKIDTWIKLHAKIIVMLPKYKQMVVICIRNLISFFMHTKKTK